MEVEYSIYANWTNVYLGADKKEASRGYGEKDCVPNAESFLPPSWGDPEMLKYSQAPPSCAGAGECR